MNINDSRDCMLFWALRQLSTTDACCALRRRVLPPCPKMQPPGCFCLEPEPITQISIQRTTLHQAAHVQHTEHSQASGRERPVASAPRYSRLTTMAHWGGSCAAAAFLSAFLLCQTCWAFGGMPGMGAPDEPKAAAVKSDVPYIRCQVCEAMAKQAQRTVKSMREALTVGKKLSEADIIEKLEKLCNVDTDDGEWITHYDIVESGSTLKLDDKEAPSKCNSECATIARACSLLSEEMDLTELSEALYAGKGRAALAQLACYDLTDACTKKAPPVPKDRVAGPEHVAMSEDEVRNAKLMQSMKAAGMSGQMYDRSMMEQMAGMQEEVEDGAVPKHKLELVEEGQQQEQGAGGLQDTVAAAVGQAREVATEAVSKAGTLLKGALGKLTGAFDSSKQAESNEL